MSSSRLDLSFIHDSNQQTSLIWISYASQSGSPALAHVIFDKYNPGKRLPMTFYPVSYVNVVSIFGMQMRLSSTNCGRTCKFYIGQVVLYSVIVFHMQYLPIHGLMIQQKFSYAIEFLLKTNFLFIDFALM